MRPTPTFTIVIPTRNERAHLERLLPALQRQTLPRDRFECVIVDGGSTDGTDELVARWTASLPLQLVVASAAAWRSRCRDLGWRAGRNDVVVLLEADWVPSEHWLAAYGRAFTSSDCDVVSGARHWGEGIRVLRRLEAHLAALCAVHPDSLLCAYALIAANSAVTRDALERHAGFNPCLRQFDDLELGLRLWESGCRFAYEKDAEATHEGSSPETERLPSHDDLLGLFWRHPYHLVLAMHIWSHGASGTEESLLALSERASALTLDDLRSRLAHLGPIPIACRTPLSEVVRYFAHAEGANRAAIVQCLEDGLRRGIAHERRDGEVFFDLQRIGDWLRDTTPYLECIYRTDLSDALSSSASVDFGTSSVLKCSGRYEVTLDPATLPKALRPTFNLPLPIATPWQANVRFTAAEPTWLLDAIAQARGIVSIPLDERDAPRRLSYDFEFDAALPMGSKTDESARPSSFLTVSMPPEFRTIAAKLVDDLGRERDAFATARAIDAWLQDSVLFGLLPPGFPYYRILDLGYGNCVMQMRLFVSLCRLAGIPARERCGAVLRPGSENSERVTKQTKSAGYSPFAHTWAEFFSPEHGWTPVEVQGYGARGIRPATVPNQALREAIRHALWLRHPFGTLHPYRVAVGTAANRRPLVTFGADSDPAGAARIIERSQHVVHCTFAKP